MPCSWELIQQNQVLTGILHTENTTMPWSLGFKYLQLPGPVFPIAGQPFDMARNSICAMALEKGFQYCFHLDSDVIPPHDAVLRLMRHNLPIVSGLYFRRSPPAGVPVMQKPAGNWVVQFPSNSLIDVDVVGAGCLLVRRDVLEKMAQNPNRPGKHWFDWRVDMNGVLPREECMSEDFTFCLHARRLGYSIKVDTGIQCRHIGLAQATYGNFTPVDSIPV